MGAWRACRMACGALLVTASTPRMSPNASLRMVNSRSMSLSHSCPSRMRSFIMATNECRRSCSRTRAACMTRDAASGSSPSSSAVSLLFRRPTSTAGLSCAPAAPAAALDSTTPAERPSAAAATSTPLPEAGGVEPSSVDGSPGGTSETVDGLLSRYRRLSLHSFRAMMH